MTQLKKNTDIQKTEIKGEQKLSVKLFLVIFIKMLCIFAIFFMFFGPETRKSQDPEAVSSGILAPQPMNETEGKK